MLRIVVLIIFFIALILTGVSLVHGLQKKRIYINRWYFGFGAFFIILIPNFLFQNIPLILTTISYLISAIFTIMYFETTRLKLEKNQFRGIVRSEQYPSKKD
ncbi:MAG: hypothetical protein KC455_04155 [Carnobacterium sp.]|nr:hypothetical protein [Carnobacterium sp.]